MKSMSSFNAGLNGRLNRRSINFTKFYTRKLKIYRYLSMFDENLSNYAPGMLRALQKLKIIFLKCAKTHNMISNLFL